MGSRPHGLRSAGPRIRRPPAEKAPRLKTAKVGSPRARPETRLPLDVRDAQPHLAEVLLQQCQSGQLPWEPHLRGTAGRKRERGG